MKKTSNKGFSMVELIIVIAIMAILAAALAPSLIKYINRSRLSTDISTGTSIASAAQSAMAVEDANDDATIYQAGPTDVNAILGNGDSFASEFKNVMGVTSVQGKAKKDINNSAIGGTTGSFFLSIDSNEVVSVWYANPGNDDFLLSPSTGASMAQ